MNALWVALGAAVGAPARLLIGHWLRARYGATPAAGTLVVNIIGSVVLGALTAAGTASDGAWMALVGVGFCGALTTFSTLAMEVWQATYEGNARVAAGTVALHLTLGAGGAWVGWTLATAVLGAPAVAAT